MPVLSLTEPSTEDVLDLLTTSFETLHSFYYNYQRPNQALDDRTPVEEVTKS